MTHSSCFPFLREVRGQALDIIDQDQSGDLGEDEVKTLLAAMGALAAGQRMATRGLTCRHGRFLVLRCSKLGIIMDSLWYAIYVNMIEYVIPFLSYRSHTHLKKSPKNP